MRVLVVGNRGFVGVRLVRHLRLNHSRMEIVGVDTGYYEDLVATDPAISRPHIQHWCDVRRPSRLPATLLHGVDAIIWLAALSNDPMGKAYARETHEINHLAAARFAAQASSYSVPRFILASSCSVYGKAEGIADESYPVDPLTDYAQSKVDAERALEAYAQEGFQVTLLRFSTACGWSDPLRLDLVLNAFVASAVATSKVTLMSQGLEWRPLIHVDDMARAFNWALERNTRDCLTVNVGSDTWNYQILTLAKEVGRLCGAEVAIAPGSSGDQRSYRVDFSKFQKLAPGHQPQVTLEQAVTGLHDGLHRLEFCDPDFRNSDWCRLNALATKQHLGLLDQELYWRYSND